MTSGGTEPVKPTVPRRQPQVKRKRRRATAFPPAAMPSTRKADSLQGSKPAASADISQAVQRTLTTLVVRRVTRGSTEGNNTTVGSWATEGTNTTVLPQVVGAARLLTSRTRAQKGGQSKGPIPSRAKLSIRVTLDAGVIENNHDRPGARRKAVTRELRQT